MTTKSLKKPAAKKPLQSKPKKLLTNFKPQVRSRHPSHSPLRGKLPLLPFKSVVRFGSTTEFPDTLAKGGKRIECNSTQAIKNSANKLLMKQCFTNGNVRTAKWTKLIDKDGLNSLSFPIVVKSLMGSRGRGNYLINSLEEFQSKINTVKHNFSNYIAEEFKDFNREYRLHVTKDGCFYTCRKMLKNGTPEKDRWFRNDSNSTWIMENNPAFDKPSNWSDIVSECVKALNAVGLDVGACDVKVQSAKDKKGVIRKYPDFIVIEINSAPSFGDVTLQKYVEEIPKILKAKKN